MPIDGVIILENGRPIIQSGFRSSSPAYPLLHIDTFNDALAKVSNPDDIDPVLYSSQFDISDGSSACCHMECGGLRFLCPISGDVDPLYAFAFLQTFIDILQDYFGTVSAATMKENFDIVYQLFEETLDSSGYPLTTSPNTLRDIVLPPSLLSKLLSVAGTNLNPSATSTGMPGSGPFTSPIPWRKAGLRYNRNEIYFDMVEELQAIVNKNGTPLTSLVWGKVETNSKLSGTPDVLLTFTNPHVLTDCAFHPCIRLQRWTRDKSLSFVPPDGRFTLFDYRFLPTSSGTTSTGMGGGVGAANDTVAIPLTIKATVDIADTTASINITLTSRGTSRPLEDVVVELNLGESASGLKFVVARAGGSGGAGMDGGSVPSTSWGFDPKRRVLKWEIPKAPLSSTWTLRGSYSSSGTPRPSRALQVYFTIPMYTFSALKVDQLTVSGEPYKPYQGVRGRSLGNIEWRLDII